MQYPIAMDREGPQVAAERHVPNLLEEAAHHLFAACEHAAVGASDRGTDDAEQAYASLLIAGSLVVPYPSTGSIAELLHEYCEGARWVLVQIDPLLDQLRYVTLAESLLRMATTVREHVAHPDDVLSRSWRGFEHAQGPPQLLN